MTKLENEMLELKRREIEALETIAAAQPRWTYRDHLKSCGWSDRQINRHLCQASSQVGQAR